MAVLCTGMSADYKDSRGAKIPLESPVQVVFLLCADMFHLVIVHLVSQWCRNKNETMLKLDSLTF